MYVCHIYSHKRYKYTICIGAHVERPPWMLLCKKQYVQYDVQVTVECVWGLVFSVQHSDGQNCPIAFWFMTRYCNTVPPAWWEYLNSLGLGWMESLIVLPAFLRHCFLLISWREGTSSCPFRGPHHSLQSFAVVGSAVAIPGSDTMKQNPLTLSTAAPLMVMRVCVSPHLLKFTISSLVLAALRVIWFSCVRALTSSLYAVPLPLVAYHCCVIRKLHNDGGAVSGRACRPSTGEGKIHPPDELQCSVWPSGICWTGNRGSSCREVLKTRSCSFLSSLEGTMVLNVA